MMDYALMVVFCLSDRPTKWDLSRIDELSKLKIAMKEPDDTDDPSVTRT